MAPPPRTKARTGAARDITPGRSGKACTENRIEKPHRNTHRTTHRTL
jgi:hypothetical protein